MTHAQFHLFILVLCICSTIGVAVAIMLAELGMRAVDESLARRRINKAKREYRRNLRKPHPGGIR